MQDLHWALGGWVARHVVFKSRQWLLGSPEERQASGSTIGDEATTPARPPPRPGTQATGCAADLRRNPITTLSYVSAE